MKILKYISVSAFALVFGVACNEGIDDINYVAPGPDETPPTVTISYPIEGTKIRVRQDVAPVKIDFEATDDIELQSVALSLDGSQIAVFNNFKDYRRAVQSYTHSQLPNGDHTLTATVTDLSGKSTSSSVNFSKVEPYQPTYPGEVFYMPFDASYFELLSITEATPTGSPTFVNGLAGQAVHFDAANKAYVLFPGDTLANVSSYSISFFVKPTFVDVNNDNGIDGILGLVSYSNKKKFWGNFDTFVENGSNPTGAIMRFHATSGETDTWITEVNNVPNFFGAWTHHVITYDGSSRQFKYYINGALKFTKTADWTGALDHNDGGPLVFGAAQFMTNPSLTAGASAQDWASYLTGDLDEIRIFNRALSAADVQQIYDDVM